MVGLELEDDRATAVALDETGRIVGRAQVASKDLGSAASSALDGASAAIGGGHTPIGVAAVNPESPEVQAALRALARRVAGRFVDEGAVHTILDTRMIAGFDSPDDSADDSGGGDFGFETSRLAVILAFDGIEGEPSHRARAAMRACHK